MKTQEEEADEQAALKSDPDGEEVSSTALMLNQEPDIRRVSKGTVNVVVTVLIHGSTMQFASLSLTAEQVQIGHARSS